MILNKNSEPNIAKLVKCVRADRTGLRKYVNDTEQNVSLSKYDIHMSSKVSSLSVLSESG